MTDGSGHEDIRAHLEGMLSGLSASEIDDVARQLMTSMSAQMLTDREAEPPSQRRPRRDDVVTYRIRVDLDRAKPPIWRRLELASDLFSTTCTRSCRRHSTGTTPTCTGSRSEPEPARTTR